VFNDVSDFIRFKRQHYVFVAVEGIVGVAVYDATEHYPTVTFTIRLHRKPLYYIVNLIVPCCLLSFVAVSSFLLQPGYPERLGIGT